MSEFQLYAFQAIDRPLSGADRQALRAISTRAEITATSFTNHYSWGDLKGDPDDFMDRWFDVHVYLANWGTPRLMLRFPKRLVERAAIAGIIAAVAKRGAAVWREVEDEIGRRNAKSYDRAAELLGDLKTIAEERGSSAAFATRLADIRERHAAKGRFIERLAGLG